MSDKAADAASSRLDNFTDAAFAFAVSLLVIAEAGSEFGFKALMEALWRLPVFAGGFMLIAIFWWAHVSWRRAGGRSDGLSALLSLSLIFVVMVYVYPMRVMLLTLTDFARGRYAIGLNEAVSLFTVYGVGFATMSGLTLALFWNSLRRGHHSGHHVDYVIVWTLIMTSGLVSIALANLPFQAAVLAAPWSYSLLPIAIPLGLRISAGRRRRKTSNEIEDHSG